MFFRVMEAFFELGRGGCIPERRCDPGRSKSNYEYNKSQMQISISVTLIFAAPVFWTFSTESALRRHHEATR